MPTKYTDPRLANFLGEEEGEAQYVDPYAGAKPLITEEMIQRDKQIRAARAEQDRLASIPYGTPLSQGGTATGYSVTQVPLGTRDAGMVDGRATKTMYQVKGLKGEGADGFSAVYSQKYDGGASPTIRGDVRVGTQRPGSGDPFAGLNDPNSITSDAGTRSDQGVEDRTNALQDIIDRYEAVDLDTEQSDQSRVAQNEAIRMNRDLFDKAMNFNRDAAAQKFSENALAASLAVARSAPGGASREQALFNALSSMPSIQAEGQRQANEEGRASELQALRAAGQLGQQATATRGQDEQRAETLASIGLDTAKGISDFTGLDLELDQRDREFLGEVALAVARLNLDWENLTVQQQEAELQRALAREGLDQEYRMFKEGRQVSDKDILGGIFSLGGGVIQGVATGAAARR